MSVVTRDDYANWVEHPVTKRLKDQIRRDVDNMMQMLISVEDYDLKELQGRVKASVNLLNVEYEDLYE